MLHLDEEAGDHSVSLSLDLISRLEFPLLASRKAMKNQRNDDAECVAIGNVGEIGTGRKSKVKKKNAN